MSTALMLLVAVLEAGAPRTNFSQVLRQRERLAADAKAMPSAQLAQRLHALDAELEFEALIPFARELGGRDSAPLELRRQAWLLEATALVVLGDPVAAEGPFVKLLRLEPDFALPRNVEPKVALVFRKVQVEERELARALRQAARRNQAARISITGAPPADARGGRPIAFAFDVVDPATDVRAVTVGYRREGEASFSSLALDGQGQTWRGELPAVLTESAADFTLEYYTETSDQEGPLASAGSPEAPLRLHVMAGQCEKAWRAPLPPGVFAVSSALTLGAGAVTGVFGVMLGEANARYEAFATAGGPRSFALQQQLEQAGMLAATRLTVALITAGALAVTTLVVSLLTDWRE